MEIYCPFNNVLIHIDTKWTANFYNAIRAANLNPGSQINPADYVQIVGEVIAIPKKISDRRDYKGFTTDNIRVGDKCIMRYDVVYALRDTEDGEPIFVNSFWYHGKDYWMADIQKIFAVIREDEIIMLNGYCMVENMSRPSTIVIAQHQKRYVNAATATLTNLSNGIDANSGDTVFYNPNLVQRYKIGSKEFGILKGSQILGSVKDLGLNN